MLLSVLSVFFFVLAVVKTHSIYSIPELPPGLVAETDVQIVFLYFQRVSWPAIALASGVFARAHIKLYAVYGAYYIAVLIAPAFAQRSPCVWAGIVNGIILPTYFTKAYGLALNL